MDKVEVIRRFYRESQLEPIGITDFQRGYSWALLDLLIKFEGIEEARKLRHDVTEELNKLGQESVL